MAARSKLFAGFRNEISGKRRTEKSEGNTKIRAAGRMMRAFQFLLPVSAVLRQLISDHFVEVFLGNDGHAQFEGLVPLGASSATARRQEVDLEMAPVAFPRGEAISCSK